MALKLPKTTEKLIEVLNTSTFQHLKEFFVSVIDVGNTFQCVDLSACETVSRHQTEDEVITRIKELDQLSNVFINYTKLVVVEWPQVSNVTANRPTCQQETT